MDVLHFTDPACPFAFSAEPQRLQLRWHYGDQLRWRTVMVGLAEDAHSFEAKGLTTAKIAAGTRLLQARHGMPIDTNERARLAGSVRACRAVVATRRHQPQLEEAVLRRLRVRAMAGQLLDEASTIDGAAADVGIDPDKLRGWMDETQTETELREDMRLARSPHPAALVLDHKLAPSEDGGRRYTCPSYELRQADEIEAAPGFQPWETYDVAVANLAPGIVRREPPTDATQVLEWADMPVATAEVAALLGVDLEQARNQLEQAAATFDRVGDDGYWSITR